MKRIPEDADLDRYRRALVAIQAHGSLSANELSMQWTARVALDPGALAFMPSEIRDAVAAHFPELAPAPASTHRPERGDR